MRPVFIYALCEPGTRTVRYIGKTLNLKTRLKQHLKDSARANSPLGEWLRGLTGPPNMVHLCETTEAFWQDEEARYILAARALGMPIVNSTEGGEGLTKTPELCAKISAAKSSPEARARTSEQATARWADPAFREKMRAIKASPEHKEKAGASARRRCNEPGAIEKMSARMIQVTSSQAVRDKMSKSAKVRWATEEQQKAQSERIKAAWADPITRETFMKTKNLTRKRPKRK